MPNLHDPYFYQSVTLICEHNEQGAMGIVINQPMGIPFRELLTQLEINYSPELAEPSILMGGPVHEQAGFILHTAEGQWESSIRINDFLSLTSSKDILTAMGAGKGPKKANLLLGYAGWGAGQLEDEIISNSWLTAPVTNEILFDIPAEKRWSAAAKSIGVDLSKLSSETGHA